MPAFSFALESAAGRSYFQLRDRCIVRQLEGADYSLRDGGRRHHLAARSVGPELVPDVGVGRTGDEADDSNAARTKVFAERVGETEGSMLGSVIGGGCWKDGLRGDGKIIDDGSAGMHKRQHRAGNEEEAREICVDDLAPGLDWKFIDGRAGMRDACVIDENVETLELLADCG